MEKVFIYDTMAGRKVEFSTKEPGKVKYYSCGPTVYNYIHIGNARPFVFFDIVRRYLEKIGYEVVFIQNITDIDDKIIQKANENGVKWNDISEKYAKIYLEDLKALKVKPATVSPKATEHIDEMVELIKMLEKKGYTYVTSDGVYYRVEKFVGYGKLSKKNLDELRAGARIDVNSEKENPYDFALWKFSKVGEPSWDSPWGAGRPGWHIECSAMSMKYADGTLDLHSGGQDLIFPHHENEIAQAEAATGKTFSRHWIHNAYVNMNGEKMSKSLGNIKTVHELLKKYPAEVLRILLLSTHYRKVLDFNDYAIEEAFKKYDKLSNFLYEFSDYTPKENVEITSQFSEKLKAFMNDDFNTSGVFGVIFDAISYAYKNRENTEIVEAILCWLYEWDEVFSILPKNEEKTEDISNKLIDLLIDVRQKEKKNKNYEMADYIRDQLKELGVILEDTPKGTRYKIVKN